MPGLVESTLKTLRKTNDVCHGNIRRPKKQTAYAFA